MNTPKKKEALNFFFIFAVVSMFIYLLRDWLYKIVVNSFAGSMYDAIHIPSGELDIFFLMISIISIVNFWRLGSIGYLLPKKSGLIILYMMIFYLLIKFKLIIIDNSYFEFIGSESLGKIEYIQFLLWVIFFGYLLYLIKLLNWEKKSEHIARNNKGISVVMDFPINDINSDLFNHKNIADLIYKFILGARSDKGAISIGLNGKWGTGKSSIINLVKNKLEDELTQKKTEHLLIEFSAMLLNENNSITVEFLNQLNSKLQNAGWGSGNEIKKYIFYLTGKINDLTSGVISILWGDRSSKDQQDLIINKIKELNRQIVVIIDDLDRAQKEEIIQILRLIKNIANLPNVVYIVACDKDYLIKSLEGIFESESYLEKFFNVEIQVPDNNDKILREEALKLIESEVPSFRPIMQAIFAIKSDNNVFFKDIFGSTIIADFFYDCIRTKRDLVKFINALKAVPEKLLPEILVEKLIILEMIRLKFTKLYSLLQYRSVVKLNGETNTFNYDSDLLGKTLFSYNYINDKEKLVGVLDILFDKVTNLASSGNERKLLSITNPERYELYFNYFYTDFLPFAELESLRNTRNDDL